MEASHGLAGCTACRIKAYPLCNGVSFFVLLLFSSTAISRVQIPSLGYRHPALLKSIDLRYLRTLVPLFLVFTDFAAICGQEIRYCGIYRGLIRDYGTIADPLSA
jgi:hypothetical protein